MKNCRKIGKRDMKLNDATPKITVDPETYRVTADGEALVCDPAERLPLAQRVFPILAVSRDTKYSERSASARAIVGVLHSMIVGYHIIFGAYDSGCPTIRVAPGRISWALGNSIGVAVPRSKPTSPFSWQDGPTTMALRLATKIV